MLVGIGFARAYRMDGDGIREGHGEYDFGTSPGARGEYEDYSRRSDRVGDT
jgi:hypothetical protein